MCHLTKANEMLEIACNELWPIIADNPRFGVWEFLPGAL